MCVCVCARACVCAHKYAHMHAYGGVHTCMCALYHVFGVCMHACPYVCVCVCVCVYFTSESACQCEL